MRHLLLSLGDKKCRLTASELHRYPDTLFGNIASGTGSSGASELEGSGTSTSGGSDEGTIVVSLDKLAGSPFAEWPQALDVVAALYRDNYIPIHLLEQMLVDELATAADNNKDSSKAHLRVHSTLKDLLQFMGFDAPVTTWLPITRMDFSNRGAMQVTYACIASEAAQLIFSHKPHADASANFRWANMAAFLVTTDRKKTSLDVCLVDVIGLASLTAAVKAAQDANQKISIVAGTSLVVTSSREAWVTLGAGMIPTVVQPLPLSNRNRDYLAVESATSLVSAAIGPCRVAGQSYPESISRYFAQALEELKRPELDIAACSVPIKQRSSSKNDMLPLWVVHW